MCLLAVSTTAAVLLLAGCAPGDAAPASTAQPADAMRTDPAFANPQNEVWLDLTTDADGARVVESEVAFELTEQRPGSVVVHEKGTSSEPGEAGTAGPRIACVTVGSERVDNRTA